MSAHTPGPWEVRKGEPWVIAKAYGNMKSVVHLNLPVEQSENQKADARLIAAAPELLAVLQDLQESAAYWSEYDVPLGIVDRINAAIAKATGGAA